MKKTISSLLVLFLLLGLVLLASAWEGTTTPSEPASTRPVATARPLPRPGFKRYTNNVLGYAIDVPDSYLVMSEAARQDEVQRRRDMYPDPDTPEYCLDYRAWDDQDERIWLQLIVSPRTSYASVDEALADYDTNTAEFIAIYKKRGAMNPRAAFEGSKVHELPAGKGLEKGFFYNVNREQWCRLYLEIYGNKHGYVLSVLGTGHSYEALQKVLLDMGMSFTLTD